MSAPPHSRITTRRPVGNAADQRVLHIVQGEQHISDDPSLVLITLLGSCVAACLRDERAGVGGMNHFLLPGDIDGKWSGESERIAVHAMELLVNGLLNRGASRNHLEAKIFGGARTMKGVADVGALNAEFAVDFLERERITIVGSCVGGAAGRRVQYWPVSGRARRSFMDQQVTSMPTVPKPAPIAADAGSLELF